MGDQQKKTDTSILLLVAANAVPLVGVIYWQWSAFELVSIYWFENVVIGAINVLKMLTSSADVSALTQKFHDKMGSLQAYIPETEMEDAAQELESLSNQGKTISIANHISKVFLIPFFAFHYGFFCMVHGMFVFALLGNQDLPLETSEGGNFAGPLSGLGDMIGMILSGPGLWAAIALVISHLGSFWMNYLGKGEFRWASAITLMVTPYGRIVILHMAIIIGGFLIATCGSPVLLMAILVIGKTILDVFFHKRSHKKMAKKPLLQTS